LQTSSDTKGALGQTHNDEAASGFPLEVFIKRRRLADAVRSLSKPYGKSPSSSLITISKTVLTKIANVAKVGG
jgi:hypothetical protein